jgi:hypothetical protein
MEGSEHVVWWEGHGDSARRCHRTNEFLYDKVMNDSEQNSTYPADSLFVK